MTEFENRKLYHLKKRHAEYMKAQEEYSKEGVALARKADALFADFKLFWDRVGKAEKLRIMHEAKKK